MKNTSPTSSAYDTGIYRDESQSLVDTSDLQTFRAVREAEKPLFDLDFLLTEAERYAQTIIDRYEDKSQSTKELLAQFTRYEGARRRKEKRATSLKPTVAFRAGFPRSPSKSEGIPHNVNRQFSYAKSLRSHVQRVRHALDRGDAKEAALYGYWVGRYYEALRVCQVEHVAKRGRRVKEGSSLGHAIVHGTQEEKQERWTAYQTMVSALHVKRSLWSYVRLCTEAGKHFEVSAKTVERHTTNPRKHS